MAANFLSPNDLRLLKVLKWLLGACLLTPLLMSSSLIFSYTAPKVLIWRVLIETAAIIYFYLCLKYPEFRPTFKKGGWGGFLNWSVLLFLALNFLSAFLGVDFILSFWGNLERGLGFWGMTHFILFFLMLGSVFKDLKEWRVMLKISVGAATLVSFLAIFQKITALGILLPQSDRVSGTIGNPAFFATYLIFNIFFVGYLIYSDSQEKHPLVSRLGGFLILILMIIALILTGTRGAWLGFFAGVVVFLVLTLFSPALEKDGRGVFKKLSLVFLVILFVSILSLFIARNSSVVQNNSFLSRLTSISLKDATAQSRLILWQGAWQAWQEKPLFGWGLENYETAINQYFDARLLDQEAWFDRAHNFIFDYGVAGGWLGLLAYLAILGLASFYLLKIIWQRRHGWGPAIFLLGLMAAYLAQNFFLFDTTLSYLMLFLTLAFIAFWLEELRGQTGQTVEKKYIKFGGGQKILAVGFGLLMLCIIYFFSIKSWQAARLGSQVLSLPAERFQEAASLLQKALAMETFVTPEIVYQASLDYAEKINSAPLLAQNEDFYQVASVKLKEIIQRQPNQTRYLVALAWLNLYFSGPDAGRLDEALTLGQDIKKMSPLKKDAYFILAASYALKNDSAAGAALVAQAQDINPALGEEVQVYWQNLNK